MGVKWNCKAAAQYRLQHSTCAMMGTKAGADQRGDPVKMVAVSVYLYKCLMMC